MRITTIPSPGFFVSILLTALLFGCQNEPAVAEKFTVTATVADVPKGSLVKLVQLSFSDQTPVVVDSARLNDKGVAVLSGSAKEASLYRLDVGGDLPLGIMLVNDGDDIEVKLSKANFRKPEVDGSYATEALYELFEDYAKQDSLIRENMVRISELPATPQGDSLRSTLQGRSEDLIKETKKLVADFAQKQTNPVLDFYALMMARQLMEGKEWNALAAGFAKEHPKHSGAAAIQQMITANEARPGQGQPETYALLNQQAPELNLPDASGNLVQLSSYKGRYLLVDFWASWCAPCRAENPNVVAAHKQFKDKGFDVLGVSLDKEWNSWQTAVRRDSLKWTHVSDLKEWNSSAVQLYQFQSIPFNVLLDKEGKVIASDLRGQALQAKLRELMP